MSILSVVKEKGVELLFNAVLMVGASLFAGQLQLEMNTQNLATLQQQVTETHTLAVDNNTKIGILANKTQSLEELHKEDIERLDRTTEKLDNRIYNHQSKFGQDDYGNLLEDPINPNPIPTIK